MKFYDTKQCVRCGKLAVLWCGWVEGPRKSVITAGWCSYRCSQRWKTCHGRWTRAMGKASAV